MPEVEAQLRGPGTQGEAFLSSSSCGWGFLLLQKPVCQEQRFFELDGVLHVLFDGFHFHL